MSLVISLRIRSKEESIAHGDLEDRCTLEAGENPVKKVPLVISRNEDETLIDELVYDNDEQGDGISIMQMVPGQVMLNGKGCMV